jgi:HK97 family phage portal protein
MERTKDGVKEVDPKDPAAVAISRLNKPNPRMTGREMRIVVMNQLLLEGNSFFQVIYNQAKRPAPLYLWPVNPSAVTIKVGEDGNVSKYEVRKSTDGTLATLLPNQMLQFKLPNQYGTVRGISVAEAAAMFIQTDKEAAKWNRAFFENSAQPDGVLSTPNNLSADQINQLRNELEKYRGAENTGKTMVLGGGMTFGRVSMSSKEMDFVEQRRFSRDAILSIFRVPKSVAAISDDVNRAAAEATKYSFLENNVKPKLELFCEQLTQFYLPLFGLDPDRYFIDYDDPSPKNVETDAKVNQIALSSGYLTINEVREEQGYEAIEGGDVPYLNAGLVPLAQLNAPKLEAPTPTDPPAEPEPAEPAAKKKELTEVRKKELDELITRRVAWINGYCGGSKKKAVAVYDAMAEHIAKKMKAKKSIKSAEYLQIELDVFDGEWNRITSTAVEPLVLELSSAAAKKAGEFAKEQFGFSIDFDLENPNAVEWLRQNSLSKAKLILETVKGEVREIIVSGVDEGLSIDTMAEQIRDYFIDRSAWKATRLVRTEVIGGYNFGFLETIKQTGLNVGKVWSTMNDDRVDDECLLNQDAGVIPLDKAFPTGHLSPPVHPNCRCLLNTRDWN